MSFTVFSPSKSLFTWYTLYTIITFPLPESFNEVIRLSEVSPPPERNPNLSPDPCTYLSDDTFYTHFIFYT